MNPQESYTPLPTAEDDYVERLFKVMRGYDCFFPFSDEDLRGMIRDWLRAAADLSMDVLGRLDGLTFYLHEDVNSLEDDDPVRLVFPMSIGNNVYGHRASQGDNGICHDENAAPPAAGQASAVRDAMVRRAVSAYDAWMAEHHPDQDDAWHDGMRAALEAALADAAPVGGLSVAPIGYIDRKDLARLHTYKATIWPGTNEIDAVPVFAALPAASLSTGEE